MRMSLADEKGETGTWGEIFSFLNMPESVAAQLDWATGIVGVNTSQQEWLRLVDRYGDKNSAQVSQRESELLETVTHELTHFLQIVTTGYLYRFAVNLYYQIGAWISTVGKDKLSTDERVRVLLKTAIPNSISKQVRATLGQLDVEGPEGLTTRAIVESSAFFVQKRVHWPEWDVKKYRRVLDDTCPAPAYRSAFDVASSILRDEALEAYSYITFLALCTDDPPRAFITLCHRTAELGLATGHVVRVGAISRLLDDKDWAPLGTAAEQAASLKEHPVYTVAVRRLDSLHGSGAISLDAYMATPYDLTDRLVDEAVRPMVFTEGPGRYAAAIPPQLWSEDPDEARDAKVKSLVTIAAVYTRILREGVRPTNVTGSRVSNWWKKWFATGRVKT